MRQTDALARTLLERLRAATLPTALVVQYTGAKAGTVGGWLTNGHLPRGDNMNSLQHLLAVLGIDSPELTSVHDYGRYVGRLMAFKLLTFAEAKELLGGIHDQAIYQTVRGERDPWDEDVTLKPTKTLDQLQEEYGERLTAVEDEIRRRFAEQGFSAQAATKLPEMASVVPLPNDGDEPTQGFILRSAREIGGILPLVRYLASDRCTPEDRAELRDLLGEEGMFELAGLVNQLCGERARSTMGR